MSEPGAKIISPSPYDSGELFTAVVRGWHQDKVIAASGSAVASAILVIKHVNRVGTTDGYSKIGHLLKKVPVLGTVNAPRIGIPLEVLTLITGGTLSGCGLTLAT